MSDLIELQRSYLLGVLNQIETKNNLKFLIIDKTVETILSYLFLTPRELLNNVTSVDLIDSPTRKGQSSIDAIYILEPTKFNINCIDADYMVRPPKYRRCHIRFLPGLTNPIFQFFQSKRYIGQNLDSFKPIELGFFVKEAQLFQTLQMENSLQVFFNKNCQGLIPTNVRKIVGSLVSLCVITGEYPIVRYSEPNLLDEEDARDSNPVAGSNSLTRSIANAFQIAIDTYARNNPEFPPQNTERPRSILMITDRTLDPFAPILHDFSYQAMSYDLVSNVDTQKDTYHYFAENEAGEQEEKTAKLVDLSDPDWVDLKHQHIMDANEYIQGRIKELIAKNPLLVDRSNVKNTTDLLSVVAHLKDFDEERRRLILHKTLIDECLKENAERKLADTSTIEQSLSGFGLDFNGEKTRHIIDDLLPSLMMKEPKTLDKLRYIIAYALFRGGIIELDFIKLLNFIGINHEHENFQQYLTIFRNYSLIDFKLIKDKPKDKPFQKEWFHDTLVNDPNIFHTSRFVPAVGNILSKVIANPLLLSEQYFPYLKDKPIELLNEEEFQAGLVNTSANSSSSLRNPRHKAAWTTKNSSLKKSIPRQRFFYYVIGGISLSEVKAAYGQSNLKNRDIFIGSDEILTPMKFLDEVKHLQNPREFFKFKEDQQQQTNPPDFLLKEMKPVAQPVSHIHLRSQNDGPKPGSSSPAVAGSPNQELPEKEKKRSKFSRFLKRKSHHDK
ncbi:hypothetical protein SEUBUCD646_0B02860 [Saccharomyces eubayanus]|uniref:SEC1-like protein n=1 Tax=Saccharomyces eubayanus TaxID=1080349 RepID=A0ABN8VQM7_SACEU|nr:hypothetical protein SEUBUCD650_0B02870 [Saccharomyces eubayanus]CAI1864212.1 hypothetical protein SEUBUCD646_0B02860 [Saccharomyces eubayanus]